MRRLYSLLYTLAAILSGPYWLSRALREKKYLANFRQRLGWRIPQVSSGGRPIWLHAVSVGEVLAARSVFAELRRTAPTVPLVVSTVTLTGQELARKELKDADAIFYFPFDWFHVVRRFLNRLRPRAVVILETELWPNFLAAATATQTPVVLVNGRLSDKSVRRYACIRSFSGTMLSQLARIGVQSAEDRRRFLAIGAPEDRVQVTGNLKFDFPACNAGPVPDWLDRIARVLGSPEETPIIVVGSTMRGEEELIITAFGCVREALPLARLVVAPRHPERFDEVHQILQTSGLSVSRRSRLELAASPCHALLLDTIGELRAVYGLASVAVIGGSFLPLYGGHNPLEPASLGKATVFGPHMTNFREIAAALVHGQAARQVTAGSLAGVLVELLKNPQERVLLGQRAAQVVRQNRGATAETTNLIRPYLG
jgi:3-deoxy-D-manno-octulosonic-acid transferase